MQSRLLKGPLSVMGPKRHLELMLDVEQPYPDRACEQNGRQLHEHERPNPDGTDQSSSDGCDRDVGRHGAEPGLPAAADQTDRQPVPQDEQIGGTDAEHDERVPVRAIAKTTPEGERQIFAHR